VTKGQDTYLVKDVLETALGKCRALDVLDGAKLAGKTLTLLRGDGSLLLTGELVEVALVITEVDLGADN